MFEIWVVLVTCVAVHLTLEYMVKQLGKEGIVRFYGHLSAIWSRAEGEQLFTVWAAHIGRQCQ